MKQLAISPLLFRLLLLVVCPTFALAQPLTRLVVMTDIGGDPDDQQSLVRLLVHADQFELEGLLTSSRLEHGQDTQPELIHQQINAYEQVYKNLNQTLRCLPFA